MQGLVVVGLIVEEIWNVNVKCVKVSGAENIGQGHWVKVPAESYTMFVGYRPYSEISNVDVKCVKVTGAQNIGQGHQVKVPAKSLHLGEVLCRVGGCRPYS